MYMMPGDPIDMVVDQKVSAERKEEIRHEMGYDQPFLTQYKNWVSDVVHGDFGTSTRYKMQVWDLMEQRIPYSLKLCGWIFLVFEKLARGFLHGLTVADAEKFSHRGLLLPLKKGFDIVPDGGTDAQTRGFKNLEIHGRYLPVLFLKKT